MWRFLVGLLLGLCLAGYSFALIGTGHGTTVPMAFAASLLAFMVDLGPVIPALGMPLLWGCYFLLIPDIDPRVQRFVVLFIALGLHLLIGVLFYVDDPTSMGAASGGSLILFFALLLISMSLLVFISSGKSQ